MHSFPTDLATACEAAQQAGAILRAHFGHVLGIREKSDDKGDNKGLVTEADTAAEQAILDYLRTHSTHPILSEESGFSVALASASSQPPASSSSLDPFWIVDPLDGTTNFARGLPWFAVSIALLQGSEILLGVVFDPLQSNLYCATRGGGAFCNGLSLQRSDVPPKQPAIFLNHGYALEDRMRFAEITRRLVPEASLRMLGPTALEICQVACGKADGFVCSGDEIWDFAAGMLIATEAGCIASDWAGQPWNPTHNFVLIAAPWLHPTLTAQINDLQSTPK